MTSIGGPSNQYLSVVPGDVKAIGRFVYNIADTMQQALNAAGREVDSLLSQHWTGDAATEFSTGWSEAHHGGTELMQELTSLAEKLGVTADTFRSTDIGSATRMSSLDLP